MMLTQNQETNCSFRDRAPLRISQVLSACSFCKARKIRCDGVTPTCGGCAKFGRRGTCSLSAGGTHRVRDYPTHLQNRVQKLEQTLKRLETERLQGQGPPSSSRVGGDTETPLAKSPSAIDKLIADIGTLPMLASSYSSNGSGPTLSTILLGAASKAPLSPLTQSTVDPEAPSWMPKRDIAMKLALHYVEQVYPRLPFFSLQGFWAQFNVVFPTDSSPLGQTTILTSDGRFEQGSIEIDQKYCYFTVLIVLSISSSSLSRSADSVISSQARRLFSRALQFRESAVRPNTIVGVQSLLFLIQYAMLNPSILDAWCLIGVGMRNCIDLGLHQDPQPPGSVNASLLETRRRLWWSMYSFDRSMSLSCGRPTEISDSVIGACLPNFRIESVATEADIQGYLQRYRALQLQSQIYDSLNKRPVGSIASHYQVISNLSKKLEEWEQENMPSHSQILVRSELLMGKMLLYRPCRLLQERSPEETERLWAASTGFVATYRQLVESNGIFYVQIASEKIYWAGLAILYSFWKISVDFDKLTRGKTVLKQIDVWKSIQDVMFILQTLSERWESGKILARQFEEISTCVAAVVENHADTTLEKSTIPFEILNFRSYVSLTSITDSIDCERASLPDKDLRQLIADMVNDAG